MNLFETIDGFFRGVVYFFYNFLETIFLMARRPLTGPLWLHKRHENKCVDQMGGFTFLFIAYFVCYFLYLRFIISFQDEGQQSEIARYANNVISSGDSFSWDFFWPILIATFVSIISVDAILRLVIFLIFRQYQRRRRILNDSLKFSLFWPACFLLLAYPLWQVQSGGEFSIRDPRDWRSVSVIVIILVLSYPAARIFMLAVPSPKGWIRPFVNLLIAAAIFAIMYGSARAAISLAAVPLGLEDTERTGIISLHVDQIRCTHQEDGRLYLYAVISNEGRKLALISPGDLSVWVAGDDKSRFYSPGGTRYQLLRQSNAAEAAELLAPGASSALTLFAAGVPASTSLQYCSLVGFSGMNEFLGDAAPIYPETAEVEERRRIEATVAR